MTMTRLIAAIKVDNKIMKSDGDRVRIPFGCEYSIYLKNIECRKAAVEITVDGKDILGGKRIILSPNESMTLERFVGEDMNEGRKLRFIEKTEEISNFRGDKPEDGLVVITYRYEAETPIYVNDIFNPLCGHHIGSPLYSATTNSTLRPNSMLDGASLNAESRSVKTKKCSMNDKGITVEGSKSSQSFRRGEIGTLEICSRREVIELVGYVAKDGITPDEECAFEGMKYCPSCGTVHEAADEAEYCPKDGTHLKDLSSIENEGIIEGLSISQEISRALLKAALK